MYTVCAGNHSEMMIPEDDVDDSVLVHLYAILAHNSCLRLCDFSFRNRYNNTSSCV